MEPRQATSTAVNGIHRAGPPQAIQKIREHLYAVQVPLSEPPSADWKRFFYDAQRDVPADFPPRAVDVSGASLKFRADAESVPGKIALLDRWIERANQKEAGLGARSEEDRQRREQATREHRELAELNEKWRTL
jgi:hypothetical protein